jgi:hypothetical protein
LSAENYDILVSNAANFATVLLKKYDQCLAVLKCTHLFFNPEYVIYLISRKMKNEFLNVLKNA